MLKTSRWPTNVSGSQPQPQHHEGAEPWANHRQQTWPTNKPLQMDPDTSKPLQMEPPTTEILQRNPALWRIWASTPVSVPSREQQPIKSMISSPKMRCFYPWWQLGLFGTCWPRTSLPGCTEGGSFAVPHCLVSGQCILYILSCLSFAKSQFSLFIDALGSKSVKSHLHQHLAVRCSSYGSNQSFSN